jgi:hypothetical protein
MWVIEKIVSVGNTRHIATRDEYRTHQNAQL